jgi:hypothetical protein
LRDRAQNAAQTDLLSRVPYHNAQIEAYDAVLDRMHATYADVFENSEGGGVKCKICNSVRRKGKGKYCHPLCRHIGKREGGK